MLMLLSGFVYHADVNMTPENLQGLYNDSALLNTSQTALLVLTVFVFYYTMIYTLTWFIEKKGLLPLVKPFKLLTIGLVSARDVEFKSVILYVLVGNLLCMCTVLGFTGMAIYDVLKYVLSIGGFLW